MKTITAQLKTKISRILDLDSPKNYLCWEDAEESVLDELTDKESLEYTNSGCPIVEEWFAANAE